MPVLSGCLCNKSLMWGGREGEAGMMAPTSPHLTPSFPRQQVFVICRPRRGKSDDPHTVYHECLGSRETFSRISNNIKAVIYISRFVYCCECYSAVLCGLWSVVCSLYHEKARTTRDCTALKASPFLRLWLRQSVVELVAEQSYGVTASLEH